MNYTEIQARLAAAAGQLAGLDLAAFVAAAETAAKLVDTPEARARVEAIARFAAIWHVVRERADRVVALCGDGNSLSPDVLRVLVARPRPTPKPMHERCKPPASPAMLESIYAGAKELGIGPAALEDVLQANGVCRMVGIVAQRHALMRWLHGKGHSKNEIAGALKVDHSTVSTVLGKHGEYTVRGIRREKQQTGRITPRGAA